MCEGLFKHPGKVLGAGAILCLSIGLTVYLLSGSGDRCDTVGVITEYYLSACLLKCQLLTDIQH